MLSRRKLFSLLPASALWLAAPAEAQPAPLVFDSSKLEPSAWVEVTCQQRFGPEENWEDRAPCGQKFKTLRLPQSPVCPKCGCCMDISRPGLREQFMGIPVREDDHAAV